MSPPDTPRPPTAFGCPRYSACEHAFAPAPPRPPRARQRSEPPPRPRSDPRKTSFARDTWIAGSPSTLLPQPVAPTVPAFGWPNENVAVAAAALPWCWLGLAAAALGSATSPTAKRGTVIRWMRDMLLPTQRPARTGGERAGAVRARTCVRAPLPLRVARARGLRKDS